MKIFHLTLFLTIATLSANLADYTKDVCEINQGVFVLESKDGKVNVLRDEASFPTTPSTSKEFSPNQLSSLKAAWQEFFNAILLGDETTANIFFESDSLSVLRCGSVLGGFARVLTVGFKEKSFRVIVAFTFHQPGNGTLTILDAQTWRRNDRGEWHVQSMMY